MDKNIKKYKVSVDSDVYAISLVTDPAIEETFVALNADKPKTFANEEKHILYGAALRPNFPIYRNDEDGEYYLVFGKDAIEKMATNFMRSYRQHNVTLQHEEEATEMFVAESWIKADKQYDKSVALGLDQNLPVGTWFVGMKVNNIETWQRVKDGELRGFSVEAMIGLDDFSKQIKEKNDSMKEDFNEESFFSRLKKEIKEAFGLARETELEEQPQQTVEEPQPQAAEPQQAVEEPKPIEEPKPQAAEEPKPVEEPKTVEEPKASPLEELVKTMQQEIEALKKSNADLTERIGKQPSARPLNVNASPTADSNGMGNPQYSAWREQMKRYL